MAAPLLEQLAQRDNERKEFLRQLEAANQALLTPGQPTFGVTNWTIRRIANIPKWERRTTSQKKAPQSNRGTDKGAATPTLDNGPVENSTLLTQPLPTVTELGSAIPILTRNEGRATKDAQRRTRNEGRTTKDVLRLANEVQRVKAASQQDFAQLADKLAQLDSERTELLLQLEEVSHALLLLNRTKIGTSHTWKQSTGRFSATRRTTYGRGA